MTIHVFPGAMARAEVDLPPVMTASAPQAPPRTFRGRLFRKYLLLILVLVGGALLTSGAVSIYFGYQENKAAIGTLQSEKAIGAASRIEQYIDRITQQLAYASLPQIDASDLEARRIEFLKLLRQAPEVTDIAQLDPAGLEVIAASRLGMDRLNSRIDRAQEPAFVNAKRGKPWYSPVYFRKETEPYMTISLRSGGERGPVTIADVNLKFIWDVVSRIKIGDKGKAYVVDRSGYLVADPDIGLVLRKTDLANLPHVKAAAAGPPSADEPALKSGDLAGTPVLASWAPIESLGWNVFVEQPITEVYARLNASIVRTGLLLLAGLAISALGAAALARGMVRPIRTLEEGAQHIGEGDLDQRIDVRTGDELEALAGRFNRMSAQLKESYAGLERKVEARTQELSNSLEQQTAISEILRVISSSPTDVEPVLKAVAERAAHLCDAPFAFVVLVEGSRLRPAAVHAIDPEPGSPYDNPRNLDGPFPLKRTFVIGRAAVDRQTVHVPDILPLIDAEYPDVGPIQQRFGFRALLAVPLMREGGVYGVILIWRRVPGPFSHDQIALLQTFARQAAIAIDNVRLFDETREALDQQTAISEVLRVIASTPGDIKPMLGAVAERALRLCSAIQSTIVLVDGDRLHAAAQFGDHPTLLDGESMPLTRGSVSGRSVIDGAVVHLEDLSTESEEEYPVGRALQRRFGHRAILSVPLMREDRAIGAIALWRLEPRRFSEKQVALVKTFADQAAIAIENVRLFNETKEALEQQTAISEILRVISSSPTDVQPVLEAIADRAARLCDAAAASMYLTEGNTLRHLASKGPSPDPVGFVDSMPINADSISGRALLDRRTIQVRDMLTEGAEFPLSHEIARRFGHRTVVVIPLFREGNPFGTILLRRQEVRLFSEREIALLATFGDQAAIALENVRLFNETKEALDQQTAVSDMLRAISRTTFDLQPVFATLIESAARLCRADKGFVYIREGGAYRMMVNFGSSPEQVDTRPLVPEYGTLVGRTALTRDVVRIDDARVDPTYTWKDAQEKLGFRSMLGVPMLREGESVGVIAMWREEVRPFTPREVQLVTTFADQAVIAIENVRLFNETKEALDQQRASAEVLAAISSSIADTTPVFSTIVERCERLFAGRLVQINLVADDGLVHLADYHGPGRDRIESIFPFPLDTDSATGTSILTRAVMHYPDVDHGKDVPERARKGWQALGVKAAIVAPMVWEDRGVGAILVGRDVAGAFSEKEIALLKTFASQAVIAIQNARLVNETKEALDQQRASGEVLAAISSSIADTKPVFDTILQRCQRLFSGDTVGVTLVRDDGMLDIGAYAGPGGDELRKLFPQPLSRDTSSGLAILERRVLTYGDVEAGDMPPRSLDGVHATGLKSITFAPMLSEGRAIGTLWVGRSFRGAFSDKQITLLKTFAEQAVIAIQNARLFNETKDALEQQRASGEVLAAISSSIADTRPVFDRILASCEHLFSGKVIAINLLDEEEHLQLAAYHGPDREKLERTRAGGLPYRETGTALAIARRSVLHYSDIVNGKDVPPGVRQAAVATGMKACIVAPMLWEDKGIGSIFVSRDYTGRFSDKEIALLKTFADQAVIAIQNARLFREIEEKSRQLEIANKHKSEFLANMSHELRTPLNAIIGFSEVLQEKLFGDVNEKQEDYLRDIYTSGKHLLGLINDILDLSKVEAGRMELDLAAFDVASALSNAMTLVRERAQRHNVALRMDCAPALGQVTADERKVKQILVNLLTNAVKFTPDGGRVDVIARRGSDAIEIAVRDTGIGIAPEDHEAVFEEFRQVGRHYTNKQEGTGLGLTLTRRFVELHGGRIWVESELGKGATFTFTIPVKS
ncbi:MAG TPA: GAF domain-containing protein [Casimicrobiaceae bacterium]|nr:GAF domain-containing protein [Casimicrobiaceae bacterium]